MGISKITKNVMLTLKGKKISSKFQSVLTHSFSDTLKIFSPRVMRCHSLLFKNRSFIECIVLKTIKIVNLITFLFSAVDCKKKDYA